MERRKIAVLSGDENVPAMPMKESEVNHLRRLLAWLECEYNLSPHSQRGMLRGLQDCVELGLATEERASEVLQQEAERIAQCPAYVRQAVKMLSAAIRRHESESGVIEQ